jgi:hypothetical protein
VYLKVKMEDLQDALEDAQYVRIVSHVYSIAFGISDIVIDIFEMYVCADILVP